MAAYDGTLVALAQRIAALPAEEFWLWTAAGLAAAVIGFASAFIALHKARLMENTPTSRIRSAAQGYVELEGTARLLPGEEIRAPLSGRTCCWWRYRVQKYESRWRNGRRSGEWRTIDSGTSDALFLLSDPTGDCIVDPHGASVQPSIRQSWRGHTPRPNFVPDKIPWLQFGDYQYEEERLQIGDPLYALGAFRTQTAHLQLDETADVNELLRDWKADQKGLLARFDADGDGRIDAREWETARRAAIAQVRQAHLERSLDPDIHVLSRPGDGRPFLLSTLAQQDLVRRHRWIAAAALTGSILAGAGSIFSLTARGLF
ncbi:GIDE domain-containing protein [Fontimonas sp. SYSU GA230001]|uniref:GIDE domain-containing protein n=1 Tax=Fontimonas sp. SYSU GA230001 TaxID=3142450 RepID=UPI0032B5362A